MTSNREYMRSYMRKYRNRQALLDGKLIDPNPGRPRATERVNRTAPAIVESPGWPTKAQLMAGR